MIIQFHWVLMKPHNLKMSRILLRFSQKSRKSRWIKLPSSINLPIRSTLFMKISPESQNIWHNRSSIASIQRPKCWDSSEILAKRTFHLPNLWYLLGRALWNLMPALKWFLKIINFSLKLDIFLWFVILFNIIIKYSSIICI